MQCKFYITFFIACLAGTYVNARIIRVSKNGSGNGSTWAQASSIQNAVNSAAANDEIWVKKGVYNIASPLTLEAAGTKMFGGFNGGETVRNQRKWEDNFTILDGGNSTSIMTLDAGDIVIDGIRFRKGKKNIAGRGGGGGIHAKSMARNTIIRNCHFNNNTSVKGGGAIYFSNGDGAILNNCVFNNNSVGNSNDGGAISFYKAFGTTIKNCKFNNNSTAGNGGAIGFFRAEEAVIDNCSFNGNIANYHGGGAVYSFSDDGNNTIKNSTFTNNTASIRGGALYLFGGDRESPVNFAFRNCVFKQNASTPSDTSPSIGGAITTRGLKIKVMGSLFRDNNADNGGAMYIEDPLMAYIERCQFILNSSTDRGGALLNTGNAKIVSSLFRGNRAGNYGGAIYNGEEAYISNCTFVSNTHTALTYIPKESDRFSTYLTAVYNSIFYGNTAIGKMAPDIAPTYESSSTNLDLDFRKNILQTKKPGFPNNLVGENPQFADATHGNYKLIGSSPAIDAGNNGLYRDVSGTFPGASKDLSGNDRLRGERIDIGAYEFKPVGLNCATNVKPANNATDVPVDTDITWNAVRNAEGYYIAIGISEGGNDIVDNEKVTETTYQPENDLAGNTTYYVAVTPYNNQGSATGCEEISFTTETFPILPDCTALSNPVNGAVNVPVDITIDWNSVTDAEGYKITVGTTSGGTDIENNTDMGNTTSYTPTNPLPQNTTIYVTVVPYNSAGDAVDCTEESFTTEALEPIPGCATMIFPANGDTDVPLDSEITWDAISDAEGYYLSVGTSPGGTELANREGVSGTSYTPVVNFEKNTTYYVSVIPFNKAGEAEDCKEISFTTETITTVPDCTTLLNPVDGGEDISADAPIRWNAVSNADGYRISIGTSPGTADIENNLDVGDVTEYDPDPYFPENATIYVIIVPYNDAGMAVSCQEENFTTETLTPPDCAVITTPVDGTTYPAYEGIGWESVEGADGYRIYLGTTPGGTDVANGLEHGEYFEDPEWGTYYLRVIPYNEAGEATGCEEISFSIVEPTPLPPGCTTMTSPANGDTDVPLDSEITWDAVGSASGYYISIRTDAGDIVVNEEPVIGTSYNPATDFKENTTYHVSVVPFNDNGEATGCGEINFITETLPIPPPECTTITSPEDGDTGIALDLEITWEAISDADGYHISIGTASGGTDIVNMESVTVTTYTPEVGLEENTTYFVMVTPYNNEGSAGDCTEISFTTETLPKPPGCTAMSDPADGAANVPVSTNIRWHAVPEAEGYYLTVGTSSGGTDLVDNKDMGDSTVDYFIGDWPANTTIYVTIVPYNSAGMAENCEEESFTTKTLSTPTPPGCTTIISPTDGAPDVAIDTDISWNTVADADGYHISIGTTAGGADIVDHQQVSGNTYNLSSELEENTTYHVRVVPYNAEGSASGCTGISFTTETLPTVPNCTTITSPTNGATDVATDTDISWNTVADADGYHISIGTTAGGADIIDHQQVSGNTYNLSSELEENTTYHVRVVPYNAGGSASGCTGISFTTETLPTIPDCTTIISPTDGTADIAVDTDITWDVVTGAEGYYISIGTVPGGTDMVNGQQVTGTTFNLVADFDVSSTYYVTIIPYNTQGSATGCTGTSFTTEALSTPPDCTTITSPDNGADNVALDTGITWNAVAEAAGYYVSIGTVSGGTDVVNNHQVTGTTFTPATDLDENTTYYITVIPYNLRGSATGCAGISFTTETLARAPDCTVITSPTDGASDVATDTDISWNTVADADGYYISIGTTAGGADIIDHQQVSGNTYNLTFELDENITYYVTVTPYNAQGSATGCTGTRFTTRIDFDINKTKYGFSPNGDGINDFWKIKGIESYPDNTVSVYNRWGDMVFQIQNYDNHSNVFTGVANKLTKLGGGRLPSGTYFFDMLLRDGNDLKKVKGFLVLKR